MSAWINVGEEFVVLGGRRMICLEHKRTRMVALEVATMQLLSVSMVCPLTKSNVSHSELIVAIRKAYEAIEPGSSIYLEGNKFAVRRIARNGDLIVRSSSGAISRVPKWLPWWIDVVPDELLPAPVNGSEFGAEILIARSMQKLRSSKRGVRLDAESFLRKQGQAVVPLLIQEIHEANRRIKNAPVQFVGGEGTLNLGPVRFPSPADQLLVKLASRIIADISTAGHLEEVLKAIEQTESKIKERIITEILNLRRCRKQGNNDLREAIDGSSFSAEVAFKILEKRRGDAAIELLTEIARSGSSKEQQKRAVESLEAISTRKARLAISRLEQEAQHDPS